MGEELQLPASRPRQGDLRRASGPERHPDLEMVLNVTRSRFLADRLREDRVDGSGERPWRERKREHCRRSELDLPPELFEGDDLRGESGCDDLDDGLLLESAHDGEATAPLLDRKPVWNKESALERRAVDEAR